ncbi:MAG: YicC family protein [Halioglobus sp.]|nr:YicC family protein [Halioglobus sp.]
MTAFARETAATAQGEITVELRSVNHRYLDCTFKLPDALRSLEPKLRDQAGVALARGKLDCLIRLQPRGSDEGDLRIDVEQLRKLLSAAWEIERQLTASRPLSALEILQFPGICHAPDESGEALCNSAQAAFARALASLVDNRRREGDKLAALVRARLESVADAVRATRRLLPALLQQQRDRITARIAELGVEIDQGRLGQELVYLAQKADVDEELDRLEAHVKEVRRTLEKGGPCGRRLDFLMQELNREANTLSSKSISSSTTQHAVELKVLVEQMREQIQNIE